MKSRIWIVFVLNLSFAVNALGAELLKKSLSVSGKDWSVSVSATSSKPRSHGQGFCGTGEEVLLKISKPKSQKAVFTKLIESCVHSIELAGGHLGSESAATLEKALEFNESGILIRWLRKNGKQNVVGVVDLSSGVVRYSESGKGR